MSDPHLAVFQRPSRARCPRRFGVEREIAPPAVGRLRVPVPALMQQAEIEDRIRVIRIGGERALEAGDGLVGLAPIIEHISEIVPGLGEAGVGFGRGRSSSRKDIGSSPRCRE